MNSFTDEEGSQQGSLSAGGPIRVLKFGGSSLGSAAGIQSACDVIRDTMSAGAIPVVVCSALGKSTDLLERAFYGDRHAVAEIFQLHEHIAKELELSDTDFSCARVSLEEELSFVESHGAFSQDEYASIVSYGERMSVRLMAAYWQKCGQRGRALAAWEVGFLAEGEAREALLLPESESRIENFFKSYFAEEGSDSVAFVTGFLAKDARGRVLTLGRGGSDLTAVYLGACLGAERVELCKDVAGMFSADPKRIPGAKVLSCLTYDEASELAYYGAKVLHPLAIQPAMRRQMPVLVRSTFDPKAPGTLIAAKNSVALSQFEPERRMRMVRALTFKPSVTLVDIVSLRMLGQSGFLADVFAIFQEHDISVDMVATSEVSVSLTLNRGNELSPEARSALDSIARVEVQGRKAVLSIIGDTEQSSVILSRALGTLDDEGIEVQMISHGASKTNIGLIVEDEEAERALRLLHAMFIEKVSEQEKFEKSITQDTGFHLSSSSSPPANAA